MAKHILIMDQGTTGSRGVIYDENGYVVALITRNTNNFIPNPAGGNNRPKKFGRSR